MSENMPPTADELIESNVNVYKPLILECVIGTELLSFLSQHDVSKAERNRLRAQQREHGDRKVTEELLELIAGKKDLTGRWTSFVNALKHSDYEYVSKALEGEDIKDTSEQRHLIQIFARNIQKSINPVEILPALREKNIVNDQDSEEITAEQDHRGPMAATIVLLDRIPRRVETWYEGFLDVLADNNQSNLVQEIDECHLQKRKNRLEKEQAMDTMSSASGYSYSFSSSDRSGFESSDLQPMEHCVSVSGAGYKTQKNYDAPSEIDININKQKEMLKNLISTSDDEISDDNTVSKVIDEDMTEVKTRNEPMITSAGVSVLDQNFNINLQASPSAACSMEISEDLSLNTTDPHIKQKKLDKVTKEIEKELGLNENSWLPPNIQENEGSMISNKIQPTGTDDTDSDSDDGSSASKRQRENLELRDYQQELAKPGLNGQNCIVVAPTGSGKTHVALKIIQEHMRRMRGKRVPKVVFLVEQSALAVQQGKMCKKFLDYKVKTITGEVQRHENYKELSEWLQRRDILVVTAQLLVNALVAEDVKITQFSLLVFDECHHTNLKHAFNRIMHFYLDIKLNKNASNYALPQVVGLTASVGVGKANTKDIAVKWIEKIMAHLDAEELATVRTKKQQLAEFVIVPEQTTETVARRKNNVFEECVNNLMGAIEQYMVKKKYSHIIAQFGTLKPPSGRGTEQYTQWLSVLWKDTAKVYDQDARRHFTTCRNYLECYNNALIIYFDARVKDALTYLELEIGRINENAIQDETDKTMENIYHMSKDLMESCLCEGNENPKLEKLKEMLITTYKEKPDSRGIVFVKTRDLGKAIKAWMMETPELKDLKPETFFGAQASVERGGMTKNQQEDALNYFRDGKHRVIIATSVAEEGLDIQKCNLVIKYDHATNEIAMVQSRGRGRAEDSKYVLIAETESKSVRKEELNILRESMMQDAIKAVQASIQSDRTLFTRKKITQQEEEKVIRDMERRNRKGREMAEGQFEMRCLKCNQFICMSSDVKKIMDAHHAVLCTDIGERVTVKKLANPQFVDQQLQSGVAKLTCNSCGMDLGNLSIYKGAQFPIIKIMSFVIIDSYGGKDVVKKWKKAPFFVSPLSSTDLQKRIESSYSFL